MAENDNSRSIDLSVAASDPVGAACELLQLIRTHADETERGRKLATPVVEALRRSGLMSMGVPAVLGGLETPIGQALRAIEEISYADGAAGWNVMIAFDSGVMTAFFHAPRARELVASMPRAIVASSVNPPGQLQRTKGGYRLTGRWRFGSGCQQADAFIVVAMLYDGGTSVVGADGVPEVWLVAVPAASVKILDTWHVAGLRGTGSHDFAIDNLFVEEGFAQPMNFELPADQGPLYAFPMIAGFGAAKGPVAIGIARHAIDTLKELAKAKTATGQKNSLRERAAIQIDLARAEAIMRSARAFLYQTVDEVWQSLLAGNPVASEQRALVWLAAVDAVNRATQAVDLMFSAGGATAIHESSALERCFRDSHVVGAHVLVQPAVYEAAGRVLLDLPPGTAIW
jgi:indole-3-acetate monooxygenase